MAGRARLIDDLAEEQRVLDLMMAKFPQVANYEPPEDAELQVVRIEPEIISILNYTKGFGHTEEVRV